MPAGAITDGTPDPDPQPGDGVFTNADNVNIPEYAGWVVSDIKHAFRGDLVVVLEAPEGTDFTLKNLSRSDSAADITQTFTVDASRFGPTAPGNCGYATPTATTPATSTPGA